MINFEEKQLKNTEKSNFLKKEILSKKQSLILICCLAFLFLVLPLSLLYFKDDLFRVKFLFNFIKPETKIITLKQTDASEFGISVSVGEKKVNLSNTNGDYLTMAFNKNLSEIKTLSDFENELDSRSIYIYTNFRDLDIPNSETVPNLDINAEKLPKKDISVSFLNYEDQTIKGVVEAKAHEIGYVARAKRNYLGIERLCLIGDVYGGCPKKIYTNINLKIYFEFKVKDGYTFIPNKS